MVKPPKIRHSKTRRDPVTIELEPDAVSRVKENPESPATEENPEIKPASTEEAERAESPKSPGDKVSAANTAEPREEDWVAFDQPVPDDRPEATISNTVSEGTAEFGRAGQQENRVEQREKMDTVSSIPPIEPRQEDRRGFSALAAGLVGGIIALAGAGGLQFAGLLPSPGAGRNDSVAVSALQSEVAGIKEQLTGLQSSGGDVEAVQQALGESTSRVDGLSAALNQAKSDIASLKSAVEAGGAGENAGLQALQDKIAGLEKSVATLGQAGTGAAPAEMAAISDKLAAIEICGQCRRDSGVCKRWSYRHRRKRLDHPRAERRRADRQGRRAGLAAQGGAGDRGFGTEGCCRRRRFFCVRGRDVCSGRAGCAGAGGVAVTRPKGRIEPR